MLAKTANIQKRRWCNNCCMCFCPALSILICLLLQWGLVEMLLFKDGMVGPSLSPTQPSACLRACLPACLPAFSTSPHCLSTTASGRERKSDESTLAILSNSHAR